MPTLSRIGHMISPLFDLNSLGGKILDAYHLHGLGRVYRAGFVWHGVHLLAGWDLCESWFSHNIPYS